MVVRRPTLWERAFGPDGLIGIYRGYPILKVCDLSQEKPFRSSFSGYFALDELLDAIDSMAEIDETNKERHKRELKRFGLM